MAAERLSPPVGRRENNEDDADNEDSSGSNSDERRSKSPILGYRRAQVSEAAKAKSQSDFQKNFFPKLVQRKVKMKSKGQKQKAKERFQEKASHKM